MHLQAPKQPLAFAAKEPQGSAWPRVSRLRHMSSGAASKAWSQSNKGQRSQRPSIEARWRQLDLSALKVILHTMHCLGACMWSFKSAWEQREGIYMSPRIS